MAAPALATVVTLRDGLNSYSGTRDTRLASWETTNMGTNSYLRLETEPETSGLVKFAIFAREGGPVPDNATINSATLSLWKNAGEDAIFTASRVLKNWDEMQAHWLQAANGVPWTTNGARSAGNDFMATPDGQGSVPTGNAWINIDVTSGVRAFKDQTSPNYGWRLAFVSGTSPTVAKQFISRDNGQFPSNRPTLTVDYSIVPCTPPTASFTATPSSGPAPLNVVFDASASQDGGGPITSLHLQFGDGTADANWNSKTQTQSHSYASNGQKTATLTVTNSCGAASAPVTRTITVGGQPPTANLTANPQSGQPPLLVDFSAAGSTDGDAPITSLRLQFGDGTEANWSDKSAPQPHQYVSAGQYMASLTATNAYGTSAPATRSISVGTNVCIPSSNSNKTGATVATFHSMGIYYNRGSAPSGNFMYLRYRLAGADEANPASWKRGHDLSYDGRGLNAYNVRGSVVHLQPATKYVFEVGTGSSYETAVWEASIVNGTDSCPSTWDETFPIGALATVWSGDKTSTTTSNYKGSKSGDTRQHVLLADQSGNPGGYTLYDFTGLNASATTGNSSNRFPVVISGHHIIIENCEITSYGRNSGNALLSPLSGTQGVNEDAGIKVPHPDYGNGTTIRRVVIQRNTIHNPAFGSSGWYTSTTHPLGPAPIMFYPIGGELVVRYNTTYATTDGTVDGPADLNHFNQDGLLMGGDNGVGIGSDVDIYKNLVMHYMDDGVETDGDGVNVRVWGNYFDYGGASAVSTAPTRVGPAYVWRNVYNRARQLVRETWGQESDRLYMLKSGGMGGINGGRHYIYHNTSLQPPASSEPGASGNSLGAGTGAGGNSGNEMVNSVSRNNVFQIWKSNWSAYSTLGTGNDFDYDLTNGSMGASESHGIAGIVPQYQSGNGWTTTLHSGKYRLQPGTPGHDDGQPIPNFNDGYVGAAPDRGAHEDGTPDMQFGTTASGS